MKLIESMIIVHCWNSNSKFCFFFQYMYVFSTLSPEKQIEHRRPVPGVRSWTHSTFVNTFELKFELYHSFFEHYKEGH